MKLNHVSGTGLNASPLSHSYNNLWSRNCYPVSRMSKLRLRQSETALSFSSDCPTAGLPEPAQLPPAASRETELAPPRHRPTSAPARWGSSGRRCLDVMVVSRLPPATLTLKQVPTILAGLLGQLYRVWARFSTAPCTHSIERSRGLLGPTTLRVPHSDWLGLGGGGASRRGGWGADGKRKGARLPSSPGARGGPGSWSWARIPHCLVTAGKTGLLLVLLILSLTKE